MLSEAREYIPVPGSSSEKSSDEERERVPVPAARRQSLANLEDLRIRRAAFKMAREAHLAQQQQQHQQQEQ